MLLYHGSQEKEVTPQFGLGSARHDFGAGFYLTDSLELAGEWAVYRPNSHNGYVHTYELETEGLSVFDFRKENVLAWVAELMKHRDADESLVYRARAKRFIERYGVDTSHADVIIGWRADASYFFIVKSFVRDEVDVSILPELLHLGGFGLLYVIKSKKAYDQLRKADEPVREIGFTERHSDYEKRDGAARATMRRLIGDPTFNPLNRLFSDLLREEKS